MFVSKGVVAVIVAGVVVYKLGKEIIKSVKEEHNNNKDSEMSFNSRRKGKAVNH
jgi:hypothetical protein